MTIRARFRLLLGLATTSVVVVSLSFSLASTAVGALLGVLCFLVLAVTTAAISRSVLASIEQLWMLVRDSHHHRWLLSDNSACCHDEFAPVKTEVSRLKDKL